MRTPVILTAVLAVASLAACDKQEPDGAQWWQKYVGVAPIYPRTDSLRIQVGDLYLAGGRTIPCVGGGVTADGSLIFAVYDWPEDYPTTIVLPNVSTLLPVKLVTGTPEIGGLLLHSDVKVIQADDFPSTDGQVMRCRVSLVGKAADAFAPLGNESKPIVGLQGTRMDISPLKDSGGSLYFAGRRWMPVQDRNCYVVCTPDGIIGVNVTLTSKDRNQR